MASLVQSGKYGAIKKIDIATNVFYVILFTSEAYTLQDNTTIYKQIITSGNYLSKQNIFVLWKKALTCFGINIPSSKL